jgi:long-chain fatty acid transport protein
MNQMKRIILIISLLAITVSIFAGGFALSGVGTRALSMGGAYRAIADDGTAMYWNPAGLTQINGTNLTAACAMIIPSADYTSSTGWPGISSSKIEAEDKIWTFPNIYFTQKLNDKFVYGLSVYVPYGLGAEWNLYELPSTMMTPGGAANLTWPNGFPENEFLSSIGIVDIHPSAAYQITDNLSVGAGISVFYGMIEIMKLIPHSTYSTYLPKTLDIEGSGLGFGGNFGLMYTLNENMQLGLSGKLPGSITLEGDANVNVYFNNIIAAGMGIPAATAVKMPADAEATVNLPAELGLGFAYNINKNWLVSTDFSWTGWSCMDKIEIKLDGDNLTTNPVTPLPDVELETKWEDTFRFSLGTEYKLDQGTALRAGFFFDPSPIPDEALDPTWPDVNNKFSYNIGVGYPINEKMSFDFAYEYIHFTEREIKDQVMSASGSAENMKGTYNTAINALNFGLNYKF